MLSMHNAISTLELHYNAEYISSGISHLIWMYKRPFSTTLFQLVSGMVSSASDPLSMSTDAVSGSHNGSVL